MSGRRAPVTVTYSCTDIAILNLLVWPYWASLIALIAGLLVATTVAFRLIAGYRFLDAVARIDWSLIGSALVLLIGWLFVVTLGCYWLRRRSGLHGPTSFVLTAEGVSFRNRHMDGNVFWNTIRKVKIYQSRLFLFLTHRSALIIPRRTFASDLEFARFVATVEECWEARDRMNSNHA